MTYDTSKFTDDLRQEQYDLFNSIPEYNQKSTRTWYFVDSENEPPVVEGREWVVFRDGTEVLERMCDGGLPDGISIKFDLGEGVMTGCDIADRIIDMVQTGQLYVHPNFDYTVHDSSKETNDEIIATLNGVWRGRVF